MVDEATEARRSVGADTITADTEISSATHRAAVAGGKIVLRRTQAMATTAGRATRRPGRRRDNHGSLRHQDIRDLVWVFRRRRRPLRRTALMDGIRMDHTAVEVEDMDSIRTTVRQQEDTTVPTKDIPVAGEAAAVGVTKAEEVTTGPAEAVLAAVATTTDRRKILSTSPGTRDVDRDLCQEQKVLMNETAWILVLH